MENRTYHHSDEALKYLQTKLPAELQNPAIGIICGSGLGGLAGALLQQPQTAVSYADIPHFSQSTGLYYFIRLPWASWQIAKRRQCLGMLGSFSSACLSPNGDPLS